jgi:hypothetical protein
VAGIDPRFYYLTLGLLALCTIVGFIVAYRFQREVDEDLAPPTEKDLLGPLEKAYYSGLMLDEEFERIQQSMAKQKGAPPARASKPAKPKVEPPSTTGPESSTGSVEEPFPPPTVIPTGESDPGPSPG